jgi:hypothetical protein
MSNYTSKELLKRLPKSYREVNYKTYLDIINNVMVDKPDSYIGEEDEFLFYQSYSTLSLLLDIPYTELEELPFTVIQPLLSGLDFLNNEIPLSYSSVKIKDIEVLTYKEYQSLIYLMPEMFNHIDDILEIVVVDITKEQIDKLSILEVIAIMGKLATSYKKSLNHSQKSLGWKLLKMTLKEKMNNLFNHQ